MANRIFISFVLFIIVIYQTDGHYLPVIKTSLGTIIGTNFITRNGKNISAFLRIPYAQPPIGNLRFKNPLPALPWNRGILLATEIGPPCPQINDNGKFVGDENCLFLNVYTPRVDINNLIPTMVYIHGGAFQRGDTHPSYVGPEYILDKDVVLVTIQYRLGVLGFLSTGDFRAPGNFGLKDQTLALRWVQANIENFGGDLNSITLFGQSAGGVSVNFHVLSTNSKGLFHRYIVQSGSAFCPWAFSKSTIYKKYAFALGKNFNCYTNSSEILIECLREINVHDLILNDDVFSGIQKITGVKWIPTDEPDIAGAFLIEEPIKIVLRNEFTDLPNINGVVKNEGLVVTAKLYANETLYDNFVGDIDTFFITLASLFGSGDDTDDFAKTLKEFYFRDIDEKNKTQVLMSLTNLISDVSFIFPQMLQIQLVHVRIKSLCYLYSFDYRGTYSKTSFILKNNQNIGITHADDLIYFYPSTPELFNISEVIEFNDIDNRMIDTMIEMWTNFAIKGIPTTNFSNNPYIWESYEGGTEVYLQITTDKENNISLIPQRNMLQSRMHFWAMQMIKLLLR